MKKDYMTRLERSARWRLPPQEAEDVIADYRDIISAQPRSEEELLRDLGKPRDVVMPLTTVKQYRTWLIVFAVMAACIALPALGPWPFGGIYLPELFGGFPTSDLFFRPLYMLFWSYHSPFPYLSFAAGLILSLIWFRRPKNELRAPLPRAIPVLLTVLAVPLAAMWWLLLQLNGFPGSFLWQGLDARYYPYLGAAVSLSAIWCCFAMAILGVAALVKARTSDRRWRAVYVMSLTAVIFCLSVYALLNNMELSDTTPNPFQAEVIRALILTAIGLIGTGVGLC